MNQASWERLADAVDIKFGISDHGHLERPLEDRPDLKEQVDFIEFTKQGTEYRLERVTKPAIKERKSFYNRTAGSSTRFENIYDETDLTSKIDCFNRESGEWQPIDVEALSLE